MNFTGMISVSMSFGGMRKPGFEEYLQGMLNQNQGGQSIGDDPVARMYGLPPGGPQKPGDPQPHLDGSFNMNDCVDISDDCDCEDNCRPFMPDFGRRDQQDDPMARMFGMPPGGPQKPGDPQPHLQGGPQKPGDPQPHQQGGPQKPGDPQPHQQGGPQNPGDPQPHQQGGPQ